MCAAVAKTSAGPLHVGDRVRVRSAAEILATLDDDGRLAGMPFMPEMLRWCGSTLPVRARADKTCDTIEFGRLRRLNSTVHLDDLRCDGSAHGGCQAGCLLFWREEWLERDGEAGPAGATGQAADTSVLDRAAGRQAEDGPRYSCQATEVLRASRPLAWWGPRQYLDDVSSGNVGLPRLLHGLAVWLFNMGQALSKRVLPAALRFRRGQWYPFIIGSGRRGPRATLDLQPGELVQVRPLPEILATLDNGGRLHGLTFDGEMTPYCGGTYRVERRVERLIDEGSGRMIHMTRDAIVLADVVCDGRYHLFCPRAVFPYWREEWLRRLPRPAAPAGTAGTEGGSKGAWPGWSAPGRGRRSRW